jgi:hypothetical protein
VNPLEEKFKTLRLKEWIESRMERNRKRKKNLKLNIIDSDYERIPFQDFIKLYGMVVGCTDVEARYNIEALVYLIQYLLRHEFTMSLGAKNGITLGDLYFSERKASTRTITRVDGVTVEINMPPRRMPRFRISQQTKKLASIAHCPYCEKDVWMPMDDFYKHAEIVHGVKIVEEIDF